MNNEETIKTSLKIINDAIYEINLGRTDSEDYYWWRAVLGIFGLDVENGEIILADYPRNSYADRHRIFKEWN